MKAEKKFFAWPIQQKERHAALKAEMLSVGIRPCEVQSFLLFAANSPLFSSR